MPSNEGRGYVLRRIMRRAIRHGYKLGLNGAFFYKLVAPLAEIMGGAYLELNDKRKLIEKTIHAEEDSFAITLDKGTKLLEEAIARLSDNTIPGEVVFQLSHPSGFPLDLHPDIARDPELTVATTRLEPNETTHNQRDRLHTHT